MFIGEHIVKLDDKGRLVFPAQFKAMAERQGSGALRFVVKKSLFRRCLEIFTEEEFEQETKDAKLRLNRFNEEHDILMDNYMRDCAPVEPDGKMGRIFIPKYLLEKIDVCKEVVFAGKFEKIELWAKEHYQETKLTDSDYLALVRKNLG